MEDFNFNNLQSMMNEFNGRITDAALALKNIYKRRVKWKCVEFIIDEIPEPSHRPRISHGYRFYVPGAAKHQAYFDKFVRPKLNGLFVSTPCKVFMDVYCPTPKSFTKTQKILAEMKILRPWGNVGDVDNFFKAYTDCLMPNEKRGHIGILEDDCLIIHNETNKFYSATPRIEIRIEYMVNIPKEMLSILRLNKQ